MPRARTHVDRLDGIDASNGWVAMIGSRPTVEPNAIGATRSIGRNDANRSVSTATANPNESGAANATTKMSVSPPSSGPIATMEASSTIIPETIARRVGVSRNNTQANTIAKSG